MQTVSGTFGVLAYAIGATWGNYALIYFGAVLVFVLSLVPPFFIQEPRELANQSEVQEQFGIADVIRNIRPLWGILLYDIYALGLQLSGIKVEHYWAEAIAGLITLVLVWQTIQAKEQRDTPTNQTGFAKVLAAHSFSWIGVQTMFVFIIAFLQDKMPTVGDDDLGKIIAMSFLILSITAAFLPALVLEPVAKKIGRVKTHTMCLASMAVAYGLVSVLGYEKANLYVLMAILGIGWSSIISLPFAIMSEKVNQGQMGLYMGLFNLSVVLPQLLVSLGVGLFISKVFENQQSFYWGI